MPAYRFCRPDDIPLLVRAVEECWRVHFPPEPAMTVERFRGEMRELDVWPSNSMVAFGGPAGDEPIAVSIGTKRAEEVLVLRVGVRPDHLRRGHGRHLVTSLSQKLAVLGPPRLVAEVPRALPGAEAFVAAAGFGLEGVYADWRREPGEPPGEPVPDELLVAVTVADLEAAGALAVPPGVAWERTRETIVQSADRLAGLAVASPERVEAWLLYLPAEETAGEARVVAAGCHDPERREPLLGAVLRALARRTPAPVVLPKLAADELPATLLAALGFAHVAEYARYVAAATPL